MLCDTINRRLTAARISPDDPALARIREWNAAAFKAGRLRVETRRGQFGKTITTTLETLTQKQA